MSRGRKIGVAAVAVVVLLLGGVAVFLGFVPGALGRYRTPTPALAVAYRAKETCSCVFVEGRDDEFCRAWTVASPDIARAEVDRAGKVVRARALRFWTATARFVGEGRGCVLE